MFIIIYYCNPIKNFRKSYFHEAAHNRMYNICINRNYIKMLLDYSYLNLILLNIKINLLNDAPKILYLIQFKIRKIR